MTKEIFVPRGRSNKENIFRSGKRTPNVREGSFRNCGVIIVIQCSHSEDQHLYPFIKLVPQFHMVICVEGFDHGHSDNYIG